jgi:hypothetical protein
VTPFFDDITEPAAPAPRDLVTEALTLVAQMQPAELVAFRTHLAFPVRFVCAERPEALASMHDARDFAGDP